MKILLTFLSLICFSASWGQIELSWSSSFDKLGSFSSPRATDLNGDGVKDIVFGAGRREFIPTDSSIIALDGKSGSTLWVAPAKDQVFGSPSFMDITNDGVDDVFINGRSGILFALNGRSGALVWEFLPGYGPFQSRKEGWYNFYNPQFINDIDGDGTRDIVVSNGGDVMKAANDPDRPAGYLVLISGKTGKLLSKAIVPDSRETYLSVVAYDLDEDGNTEIIFGTGGETLPGALFITTVNDLLNGDISGSRIIASSNTKGFVAPPVLSDVNGDRHPDIIAMAVDGRMIAIDGQTFAQLWVATTTDKEAYSSIAVGRFNPDSTPDFFTTVNTGVWPKSEYSISLIVDGKTGQIMKSDTVGYYQIASPVTFDLDGDDMDEVILPSNFPQYDDAASKNRFNTTLIIFDFKNRMTQRFGPIFPGSNGASTPWIGDIDNDGNFDIISQYQIDIYNESIVSGIKIFRLDTHMKINREPNWGSYMGSFYDGVFRENRK